MPKNCPDCGVEPGQLHNPGCDVERCPRCGFQMISCRCIYEVCGLDAETLEFEHPDIHADGPTPEMYARWDAEWGARRMPWTGVWPGKAECVEFGWYGRTTPGRTGWHPCRPGDEGATEDLNRLYSEARWDRESQRWVRRSRSVFLVVGYDPDNNSDLERAYSTREKAEVFAAAKNAEQDWHKEGRKPSAWDWEYVVEEHELDLEYVPEVVTPASPKQIASLAGTRAADAAWIVANRTLSGTGVVDFMGAVCKAVEAKFLAAGRAGLADGPQGIMPAVRDALDDEGVASLFTPEVIAAIRSEADAWIARYIP